MILSLFVELNALREVNNSNIISTIFSSLIIYSHYHSMISSFLSLNKNKLLVKDAQMPSVICVRHTKVTRTGQNIYLSLHTMNTVTTGGVQYHILIYNGSLVNIT